jgi:hypothetical protein
MTSATLAVADAPRAPRNGTGVGTQLLEFLLLGGTTLLLLPLAHWYAGHAGLEPSEYIVSYVAFYAAHVINDPHFSVTYLLFYKDASGFATGSLASWSPSC